MIVSSTQSSQGHRGAPLTRRWDRNTHTLSSDCATWATEESLVVLTQIPVRMFFSWPGDPIALYDEGDATLREWGLGEHALCWFYDPRRKHWYKLTIPVCLNALIPLLGIEYKGTTLANTLLPLLLSFLQYQLGLRPWFKARTGSGLGLAARGRPYIRIESRRAFLYSGKSHITVF